MLSIGSSSSTSANISCGIPQGSVLGPLPFCLYVLPLGKIIQNQNIGLHFYADDTQIYLPLNSQLKANIPCLQNCIQDIEHWLTQNS